MGREPEAIEPSATVERSPDVAAAPMLAAGVTLFTLGLNGPGYDLGPVKDWIAFRDATNPSI